MSAEAMGWVYRHSPFKGATFAVHLAIADSVNDQHGNLFFMDQAKLARKARLSRRAVVQAIGQLVDGGYLEKLYDGRANRESNEYRFLFPDVPVVYESRPEGAPDDGGGGRRRRQPRGGQPTGQQSDSGADSDTATESDAADDAATVAGDHVHDVHKSETDTSDSDVHDVHKVDVNDVHKACEPRSQRDVNDVHTEPKREPKREPKEDHGPRSARRMIELANSPDLIVDPDLEGPMPTCVWRGCDDYTSTICAWLAYRGVLPNSGQPIDRARLALEWLREELPAATKQEAAMMRWRESTIIADFIADTTEERPTGSVFTHLRRLVNSHGAAAVLDAAERTATSSAGLTGEYANNPHSFVRYMDAIIRRLRAEHDRRPA